MFVVYIFFTKRKKIIHSEGYDHNPRKKRSREQHEIQSMTMLSAAILELAHRARTWFDRIIQIDVSMCIFTVSMFNDFPTLFFLQEKTGA